MLVKLRHVFAVHRTSHLNPKPLRDIGHLMRVPAPTSRPILQGHPHRWHSNQSSAGLVNTRRRTSASNVFERSRRVIPFAPTGNAIDIGPPVEAHRLRASYVTSCIASTTAKLRSWTCSNDLISESTGVFRHAEAHVLKVQYGSWLQVRLIFRYGRLHACYTSIVSPAGLGVVCMGVRAR